jgi:hypothetical protein
MKKIWTGIITVLIIASIVGFRIYRKYDRQQQKDQQQKMMNEQFQRTQKLMQEKETEERNKKSQRRLDSLDSIRTAQYNENMRKLKEAQKRLEEEIKNKEKE